jgi:hypothetical protein
MSPASWLLWSVSLDPKHAYSQSIGMDEVHAWAIDLKKKILEKCDIS